MKLKALAGTIILLICVIHVLPAEGKKNKFKRPSPPWAQKNYNYHVIKNPKPNMKEKKYIELQKINELNADLQDDDFIFKPLSMTGDSDGNLYVYDKAQGKIFKLNENLEILKSYQRIGEGPGEISGPRRPVFLEVGIDGYLYVNDNLKFKIMKFTRDFEFIEEYRYRQRNSLKPMVDDSGTIIHDMFENKTLILKNQDNKPLLAMTFKDEVFGSLYFKRDGACCPGNDCEIAVMPDFTLLIVFKFTASVFIFKNYKPMKSFNVWPADGLADYVVHAGEAHEKDKSVVPLFFHWYIVTDKDNPETFYLQAWERPGKGILVIYGINIDGHLAKTFYLKRPKRFPRFELKQKNKFYAISGESIFVYKEREK